MNDEIKNVNEIDGNNIVEEQTNNKENNNTNIESKSLESHNGNKEKEDLKKKNQIINIDKPNKDDKPFSEVINEARKSILSASKRSNKRSTISMVIILLCSITGIILFTQKNKVCQIISWIVLGLAFVTIVLFFILNRRIDRPDFEGYVATCSTAINKVTFADGRFSNVTYNTKEKLDLGEPFANGVYSGLTNCVSRNVVHGLFDEHSFKVCECALFVGSGRQRKTSFVGKYISMSNNLSFDGRFVLVCKSNDPVDQPSGIDDLDPLDTIGNFTIYGPKGMDYKGVVNNSFLQKIKTYSLEKHLLNIIISIWSGTTTMYLSYDDLVNELPVEKEFKPDGVKQYQKELLLFMEGLALLTK